MGIFIPLATAVHAACHPARLMDHVTQDVRVPAWYSTHRNRLHMAFATIELPTAK